MTSTEKNLRLEKIKKSVHIEMDTTQYNSTNVIENTNCYSHAIGSILPYIELYRVGAISGKKPIDEPYFSIGELIGLLYQDLETLELKVEKSFEEEKINDNQYKIALFVKIYADEKIHYHFLRFEKNEWTEKFKGQYLRNIGNSLKGLYDYWPWRLVSIFKITK